jgi:hypothetical protein
VNPEFFFKKINQVLMGAKTTTGWQAKGLLDTGTSSQCGSSTVGPGPQPQLY